MVVYRWYKDGIVAVCGWYKDGMCALGNTRVICKWYGGSIIGSKSMKQIAEKVFIENYNYIVHKTLIKILNCIKHTVEIV